MSLRAIAWQSRRMQIGNAMATRLPRQYVPRNDIFFSLSFHHVIASDSVAISSHANPVMQWLRDCRIAALLTMTFLYKRRIHLYHTSNSIWILHLSYGEGIPVTFLNPNLW